MTRVSDEKSSQGYAAVTFLRLVLSCFGVAYENVLVICLHCLFSLANPDGGVAFHIYYSPPLCSLRSDVDGVIWRLSQNLYQHGTITVNLVNVYKVQSCAAGLCSRRLPFFRLRFFYLFFLFSCTCFMCVPWVCVFKEHGLCACVCVWKCVCMGIGSHLSMSGGVLGMSWVESDGFKI